MLDGFLCCGDDGCGRGVGRRRFPRGGDGAVDLIGLMVGVGGVHGLAGPTGSGR